MREKLLPQNIEAEQGVLGSIILDPEAITLVADFLRAEDFYRDAHRTIYGAVLHLFNEREPADYITLCDELERQNKLEDVGGSSYITSLVNGVPTSGNVEYYARIVERTAVLRRVIHAAGRIAALAYEESADADSVVSQAEEMIHRIGQRSRVAQASSLEDIVSRYMGTLEDVVQKRRRGEVTGLPTGYQNLDRIFGGLQKGDLITLAARPGQGKTSLALNIAQHIAVDAYQHGFRVLMFSLEMGEAQLAQRLMSMETGIDQTRLRSGWVQDDEWDTLVAAQSKLAQGKMWIDDTPGISVTEMRSRARRIQTEHGLDVVIVDYMQLMRAFPNGAKAVVENRVQEVSIISRGLKELARELNVPVLALAQLSRAVEQRGDKVPQMSDLRESGTIEQDSDIILFLHRDPQTATTKEGYPLNAIFAKHRNGPVGIAHLWFDPRLTQFRNMAQGDGHER